MSCTPQETLSIYVDGELESLDGQVVDRVAVTGKKGPSLCLRAEVRRILVEHLGRIVLGVDAE